MSGISGLLKKDVRNEKKLKKHRRTSPEKQFKELNEKLRRSLPDQQINGTMPARTQAKSYKNLRN